MTPDQLAQKAALTFDLRTLLQPFFQFKAYILFKNNKAMTLYAHEHDCSYKQCLFKHSKSIVLDRVKGYTGLINYIERTKKGQYKKAIIYMREPGSDLFNRECRRYFNGQLESSNDPELDDSSVLVLHFQVINNRIVIVPPDQPAPEDLPDFKKIVTNSLNNKSTKK
jgi:hypothetical protein